MTRPSLDFTGDSIHEVAFSQPCAANRLEQRPDNQEEIIAHVDVGKGTLERRVRDLVQHVKVTSRIFGAPFECATLAFGCRDFARDRAEPQ